MGLLTHLPALCLCIHWASARVFLKCVNATHFNRNGRCKMCRIPAERLGTAQIPNRQQHDVLLMKDRGFSFMFVAVALSLAALFMCLGEIDRNCSLPIVLCWTWLFGYLCALSMFLWCWFVVIFVCGRLIFFGVGGDLGFVVVMFSFFSAFLVSLGCWPLC